MGIGGLILGYRFLKSLWRRLKERVRLNVKPSPPFLSSLWGYNPTWELGSGQTFQRGGGPDPENRIVTGRETERLRGPSVDRRDEDSSGNSRFVPRIFCLRSENVGTPTYLESIKRRHFRLFVTDKEEKKDSPLFK